MARKSIGNLKSNYSAVDVVVEEFRDTSELKYELAEVAYDLQSSETQKVIDKILATLQTYATGYIAAGSSTVKIDNSYLRMNLLWLAIEIIKELAIVDIKVAEFQFPETLCSNCQAEMDNGA